MNHVYICIYESGSNMIHIYICKSLTYNHSSYIYRHIYNHLPYTDMYIKNTPFDANVLLTNIGLFPHICDIYVIGVFFGHKQCATAKWKNRRLSICEKRPTRIKRCANV